MARVPEGPVACTPSPIDLSAVRDLTISWLSHTESVLVLEWTEAQKQKAVHKAEEAAARYRAREATADTTAAKLVAASGVQQPHLSTSPASASTPASRSSSVVSSEDSDDARRAESHVPLRCDHAPFPFNRSSGVVFERPAAAAPHDGSPVTAIAPTGHPLPSPAQVTEVPAGIDYYGALQKAWSRQPENPPKLPPLAAEKDVNLSDIDDVLSGDSDYEELNPPVPLGLMINYFAEDWRESGLYDVVQKREAALSSQPQRR